jgi:hypothetical protein
MRYYFLLLALAFFACVFTVHADDSHFTCQIGQDACNYYCPTCNDKTMAQLVAVTTASLINDSRLNTIENSEIMYLYNYSASVISRGRDTVSVVCLLRPYDSASPWCSGKCDSCGDYSYCQAFMSQINTMKKINGNIPSNLQLMYQTMTTMCSGYNTPSNIDYNSKYNSAVTNSVHITNVILICLLGYFYQYMY